MTCRNCGAEVGADDKFCPICGITTVEEIPPRFCTHCGGELARRDRFCQRCGVPVDAHSAETPQRKAACSALRPEHTGADGAGGKGKVITLSLLLLSAALFLLGSLLHWWAL